MRAIRSLREAPRNVLKAKFPNGELPKLSFMRPAKPLRIREVAISASHPL
jgi:hypothetical protein